MKELSIGIRHFLTATSFLGKHRLLYFYLVPLALSLFFYFVLTAAVIVFSEQLGTWILGPDFPQSNATMEKPWSVLKIFSPDIISNIASIAIGLVVFFVASKISKYIILIILSPMFAWLSEVTEEKITGHVYPFNFTQFCKDVIRGIIIALRNLMIELCLIGLFTIAGFFAGPLAVLIIPLLWLISAYFYGFSMMDYTCERRKMSIQQSVEFVRKHRKLAIANGGLYALLDLIPIVGLTIGPINAVIGATSAILEIEKNKRI